MLGSHIEELEDMIESDTKKLENREENISEMKTVFKNQSLDLQMVLVNF